MLGALQTSRLSVVRTPTAAYQIAPRPKRAAALGIFLGLVVGTGLMFLLEALDTRVRSGTEIAERLDLPLLARIPAPPRKLAAHDELVMLAKPSGQHGESFRMLRTNLEFALLSGDVRTILLSSAVAKEGKSTIAANLVVALARGGRRVALVDLDLRRPHLHRFFRLPSTPGITDVALGRATLESALTRVDLGTGLRAPGNGAMGKLNGTGSLDVLPSGPLPPDPGEFVGTNRLSEILNALRDRYDLVVIDSPPMLRVGDVMTLSTKVDALLVVSRLNLIRRPALTELRRLLDAIPITKLGLALSGANSDRRGEYNFGYTYGDGSDDKAGHPVETGHCGDTGVSQASDTINRATDRVRTTLSTDAFEQLTPWAEWVVAEPSRESAARERAANARPRRRSWLIRRSLAAADVTGLTIAFVIGQLFIVENPAAVDRVGLLSGDPRLRRDAAGLGAARPRVRSLRPRRRAGQLFLGR